MSSTVHAPVPRPATAIGQPRPALPTAAVGPSRDPKALGKTLASLIHGESALYTITREWRYDAAGRRFDRLHRLLDEQFSEIGVRLGRLGARSRDLGAWHYTGHGDVGSVPRAAIAVGALQGYMLRELLLLHHDLVARLKATRSITGGRFPDHETAALLAALAVEHEANALALQALLSEVESDSI